MEGPLEWNTLIQPWGCRIFARLEWGNIDEANFCEESFGGIGITLVVL